jgi:peptidoglycan/xylan/chitin deacetylase (PgdA/CDA1 family)
MSAARSFDRAVAGTYLALFGERGGLSTFLFHGLFRDEAEIDAGDADPQQRFTVADFRRFVALFLESGHRFVSVADVLAGLPRGGKYALVTFDDGYFNNMRALPVLREFGVPAAVFVSTDHVRLGKCFWWDVLYREGRARGRSEAEIASETTALKRLRTEAIEAELSRRFGLGAFAPRGEADRPLTPDELRELASEPLITIGNHTRNHAILTRYRPDEVREQLESAQSALRQMTGTTPVCVAYPNGDHRASTVDVCRDLGLRLGLTVEPTRNRLPITPGGDACLRLGRFTPTGAEEVDRQCQVFRSDVRVYDALRAVARWV